MAKLTTISTTNGEQFQYLQHGELVYRDGSLCMVGMCKGEKILFSLESGWVYWVKPDEILEYADGKWEISQGKD